MMVRNSLGHKSKSIPKSANLHAEGVAKLPSHTFKPGIYVCCFPMDNTLCLFISHDRSLHVNKLSLSFAVQQHYSLFNEPSKFLLQIRFSSPNAEQEKKATKGRHL